jgi:hypothetical protein
MRKVVVVREGGIGGIEEKMDEISQLVIVNTKR